MESRQAVIPINHATQVGEARREAGRFAELAGLSEEDRGRAQIVVSELATNALRYAQGGEIHLHANLAGWVDILAIDRGPGISNIDRCLSDGFSTGGTPGNGLGAVQRMSNEFDLYSTSPAGTVFFCRLFPTAAVPNGRRFAWGTVSRPAKDETICGDGWSVAERADCLSVLLIDGLGHGPEAAKAAREATTLFDRDPFTPLALLFDSAHVRLQGTRGGAMAAAQIDPNLAALRYMGVGNIAGYLRDAGGSAGRGLFSHNGTVGMQVRKLQQFDYECPAGTLLIMHSDGLQTRWALDKYPGLARRHPAVIAAVLYRDFTRGRDDVTVIVVRFSADSSGTG
ncbi:MAG TPA: ATP-binding protein [Pirellulales bacterium]|nr:ATP-binding protein [Pirellulales bacterium]